MSRASRPSSAGGRVPVEPTILSRKDLRRQGSVRRRKWWLVSAGLVVVAAGVTAGILLTRGSASLTSPSSGPTCPLTGEAATGGVPERPALAVKIGNYSGDRPSAGLNQADVVFEEPVEGEITRLVAVFQCQSPALVGDVRSAREPDVGILSQLSDPIFVHAGGIDPVLALLNQANLVDDNVLNGPSSATVVHQVGRIAPYSTFVRPSAVWALNSSHTTAPAPLFDYTTALPKGATPGSGAAVHVPFSSSSDVTWKWDASTGRYLRYYSGSPDTLIDGTQTFATNVVVMTVRTFIGPWVESAGGAREVEVVATGSGPLLVLRGGTAITGTWSRSNLDQPATLSAADGSTITLQPGNTWVELVPQDVRVTPTSSTP
jgi:hypothetical protein